MDLYGWDFACACSSRALNKLLELQFKATPASLSFDDGAGTTIYAQLDAWRIVAGGSDKKLHIEIPVRTGTISTPLASGQIDGVVIVAEIELAFVLNASAKVNDLKFNFTSVASQPNDPKTGSVLIVTPDRNNLLAKLPNGGVVAMALHDSVPRCLIANNDKLSYVFASLNLTPTGAASWFTPQNTTYIYVQGGAASQDYLALLGMVSNADTSKLARAIDPSLCDGKNDVCIGFSGQVFLEHVVKPKLPASYVGATDANFVMRDLGIPNTSPIIMNSGALTCPSVRSGLIDYTPVLSSFGIGISGANMMCSGFGAFDITGLADSSVSFTETVKLKSSFDSASGKLTMAQDGTPTSDYTTHVPWWIYVVAAPTLIFVGPLVLIIVDVVIASVCAAVANSVSNNTGKLDLSNWSANVIEFPGAKSWAVKDAGLSSAFYLRCTIDT
ncbi:TULIP family P47-like protein [Bradyrhizobium manausense]|uniref:TULIP family P47-like protein n=1 Tax=Bradyrhizobium manausense TaxID=989370 RepID=UPI001BAB2B6C|nr:TULIP family P47-like protein [Bradyrhizobium manausense]MBR1086415.1 TULIP family P47-like protein [Bradyrhizobium manausense]